MGGTGGGAREEENGLSQALDIGKAGYKVLDKMGAFGGGLPATAGPAAANTASMLGIGNVGSIANAAAVPSLATSLAGGAFGALGGLVASKIIGKMTEADPALTFQGGKKGALIPTTAGAGGEGRTQDSLQHTGEPAWKSDKFNFSIGAQDLTNSAMAGEMGSYLDSVFEQMQAQTDVDINSIIEHGLELTDWNVGGPDAMAQGVIDRVAQGIQTGQPMSPYYARNRVTDGTVHEGANDQQRYVTDLRQVGYDGNPLVDERGNPLPGLTGEASASTPTFGQAVYNDIAAVNGDANFAMPDISSLSALAAGTQGFVPSAGGNINMGPPDLPPGATGPSQDPAQGYAFNVPQRNALQELAMSKLIQGGR